MWDDHPYNADRGGPCRRQLDLLTKPEGMAAVKHRIGFVVERWGVGGGLRLGPLERDWATTTGSTPSGSTPAPAAGLMAVVADLSEHVRAIERRLFGRTHLQTVSHFGAEPRGPLADLIFRHPDLDFATTHVYEPGAIDAPDEHRRRRRRHGPLGPPRPRRDPGRPPVHRQRDRPDPHVQGSWALHFPTDST